MGLSDLLLLQSQNMNDNESRCFSITTGVVKNNYDEKQPGRILVELHYGETGKTSTEWIRVMQPYCGKEFGDYFIPEIGSEVVLGFVLGSINNAIVLGCVWNDKDVIPPNMAEKDNSIKCIKTKGGHEILFNETKNEEKLQITTKGKLTILMEDKDQKISIKDEKGENLICLDSKNGQINVSAKKKIVFKAGDKEMLTLDGSGKKASLTADNVEVNAAQALTLEGQNVKLEGSMTALKASGSFKAESSAVLELKGAMVKIN